MKKLIQFLKGGFILLLIVNIIFTPKTFINFINVSQTIYYKNEYKLSQKKIDTITTYMPTGHNGSHSTYYIAHYDKNHTLRFFDGVGDNFKHFNKTVLNSYYNRLIKKEYYIWVWEHPIAPDYYAINKESELNIKLYIKRLLINLFFIITAIISIFWIKKNIKFKRV